MTICARNRAQNAELRHRGRKNAEIWTMLAAELAERRVAVGELTERQLRRIVYG